MALGTDEELKKKLIRVTGTGLANYLLDYNPQYIPSSLPLITLNVDSGKDQNKYMPSGVLCDFLSVGSYDFVSQRLYILFEKNSVDAFYSKANIMVDGLQYPEPYYLFAPRVAIRATDKKHSIFESDIDDPVILSRIKKLVLDENKVPKNIKLFVLGGTSQSIYLIVDALAKELSKLKFVGIKIESIEDGEWMY